MTPHPRTIDDASILEAAGRLSTRHGSGKFTLAGIPSEAGLSAATLVQRFGSNAGLMLAPARSARDAVDGCFQLVRTTNPRRSRRCLPPQPR